MGKEPRRELDFLLLQYQTLSDRQISHNSLVWNTPSLFFVAQAFLWDISLSADRASVRCLVSLAAVLISFASLQTFVRNRLMEIGDSEQLYAIEQLLLQQGEAYGLVVHHTLEKRTVVKGGKYRSLLSELEAGDFYRKHRLARMRSFQLWRQVLIAALVVTVVIFLYNLHGALGAWFSLDILDLILGGSQ